MSCPLPPAPPCSGLKLLQVPHPAVPIAITMNFKTRQCNVPEPAESVVKNLNTIVKTAEVSPPVSIAPKDNIRFLAAPINCTISRRLCTNPNWTAVMTQYCPQTCGLCNAGGACSDKISGCKDMVGLCENVNFFQYMRDNCARTCGTCTSTSPGGTCVDIATNCATNVALCNNSVSLTLMTHKCAKTCNRCSGSGTGSGSTCTDTNASCGTWVQNGFCNNSFYTAAQKRQYCGRSCSLC